MIMNIQFNGLPSTISSDIERYVGLMAPDLTLNHAIPDDPATASLWICHSDDFEVSVETICPVKTDDSTPNNRIIWLARDHSGVAHRKNTDHIIRLCLPLRLPVLMDAIRRSLLPDPHARLALNSDWSLDTDQLMISDHQGTRPPVLLTQKESALLAFLLSAQAQPVKREALLNDIWGYGQAVDTHTLETHIYRLRTKLAAIEGAAELLRTLPDGYVFGHWELENR
jgi:hypothetical protein